MDMYRTCLRGEEEFDNHRFCSCSLSLTRYSSQAWHLWAYTYQQSQECKRLGQLYMALQPFLSRPLRRLYRHDLNDCILGWGIKGWPRGWLLHGPGGWLLYVGVVARREISRRQKTFVVVFVSCRQKTKETTFAFENHKLSNIRPGQQENWFNKN